VETPCQWVWWISTASNVWIILANKQIQMTLMKQFKK